tara:strand:- start:7757 stop:8029 length:273 start_codon:yes stop_codon:yes gene_type:complete
MTEFKHHHAIAVDPIHIFYLCKYDKKICKEIIHFHGSCGNTIDNRVESRGCHCPGDKNKYCGVEITIDENTLRKSVAARGNSILFKKYRI